ncbi:MerR family transcriptional regulator [Fictibacillus sp. KIGAM418]|uniref:MerR family transcriptional regulator n=1 Tax=Fictibacillus marinisediminis TaxID=2878389 RepID=A0A9X1XAS9_9BACL|nr:MerR family transcriptional regulator [Fictibacillus marinisediminis]MCK6257286.1 MerR family transcriptional regulator [Fictibacillus marinisediminis]
MKNRFSIGQMAKLHSIPVKTLRYYDEIGLFTPVNVDPVSGYRYYSFEQFELLDIIYYLKSMGVPLKQIKLQLEKRNLDSFLDILQNHKEDAEEKIRELESISKRLEHRITEIQKTKSVEMLGIPEVKHFKERAVIQMKEPIASIHELEYSLRKIKTILGQTTSIVIGKVGLTVPFSFILEKRYTEYNSVFLLLESPEENSLLKEEATYLSEGNYACISFRGTHSDAPVYYDILLNFLEKNNLEAKGDAIERVIIDEFISNRQSDHFAEIQILVEE